jgi:hypothetical protein
VETSQSVLFLDSSQGSEFSLLFLYSRGYIRNHDSQRIAGYDWRVRDGTEVNEHLRERDGDHLLCWHRKW